MACERARAEDLRSSSPPSHMARIPRIDLPGMAQHIIRRGNDRQACFADDADNLHYRQELRQAAPEHDCAVHAYVLTANHVHLLVTPHAPGASSRMMQALGRRYVGSFNARYRRTGNRFSQTVAKRQAAHDFRPKRKRRRTL